MRNMRKYNIYNFARDFDSRIFADPSTSINQSYILLTKS